MQFIFRHSTPPHMYTQWEARRQHPNQLKPADIKGLRRRLILLAKAATTGHPQCLTQNIESINPVVTCLLSQH